MPDRTPHVTSAHRVPELVPGDIVLEIAHLILYIRRDDPSALGGRGREHHRHEPRPTAHLKHHLIRLLQERRKQRTEHVAGVPDGATRATVARSEDEIPRAARARHGMRHTHTSLHQPQTRGARVANIAKTALKYEKFMIKKKRRKPVFAIVHSRHAAARDHICPPSSGTGERKSAACENSAKLKGSSGLPLLLR